MQIGLFSKEQQRRTEIVPPRLTARNARKTLADLKADLASAKADLADCEYTLHYLELHWRASDKGLVDANWWQGAIQYGIWHHEAGMTIREDGRYPVKVRHWLRHLLVTFHAERRDISAYVADLTPKVEEMASLIGELQ